MLSIIVAVSLNGVIGNRGQIPWRLPSDLKRFKELTTGEIVIMGRKTYESIPPKFRPLPNRTNVVLSRSDWQPSEERVLVRRLWSEVHELVANKDDKVFVIGGQTVYELALPEADVIYRTVVQIDCLGDTFFSEINPDEWELSESGPVIKNEDDQFSMIFETWRRH